MQVDQVHDKGSCGTSGTEVQASKRQKLDGGVLRKVMCLAVISFTFGRFSNRRIVMLSWYSELSSLSNFKSWFSVSGC